MISSSRMERTIEKGMKAVARKNSCMKTAIRNKALDHG
jgi:hypothetical protein